MRPGKPIAAALLVALSACSSTEVSEGLGEPLRVEVAGGAPPLPLGQFVPGELPSGESGVDTSLVPGGTSTITSAGATEYGVRGWASTAASSVGLALDGLGSGYWVLPVGAPDVTQKDRLGWRAQLQLARDLPPGNHDLLAVAFDEGGRAGPRVSLPLCVQSAIPDNLNACRNTLAPPFLVISLDWNRAVDLDLRVVTPDGRLVDAKNPTTALEDPDTGKADPTQPGTGILDADSNHGCHIDGRNRENLVFQEKPEPGTYAVYAGLFAACGEPSVVYTVSLHTRADGDEPGTFGVTETFRKSGALRAIEADGGSRVGAFVTQVRVE